MTETKPEWLKALEAQSWQAELIASGLAIYGSFSLGTYLDYLSAWSALHFNDRVLWILYFFFIYVFVAHSILVVSFIVHLLLRILWVGILGLSSVYPVGINLNFKSYSEDFKTKLKEDFPDLSGHSLSLDKLCSLIFSILCALIIILASISFWLLVYIVISELLIQWLPAYMVRILGFSLIILFVIYTLVASLTTQGVLKNSTFAKKYAYFLTIKFSKLFYLFGFKSFNYIVQTIRTNVTSKLFFFGYFGILITSMMVTFPRFVSLPNLLPKRSLY